MNQITNVLNWLYLEERKKFIEELEEYIKLLREIYIDSQS